MKKATTDHQITAMTEQDGIVRTVVSDREHLGMIQELLCVLAIQVSDYRELHGEKMCFGQYEDLGTVETRLLQCADLLHAIEPAVPSETDLETPSVGQ